MALSRVKTWIAGEVLTASDLNSEFNNILNNPTSLISPLTAAFDFDGFTITVDAAAVTTFISTASIGWSFTPGAKSGTPGTTGTVANWAAQTFTDSNTAGSGTATSWTGFSIQRPTLAASNASVTTTDAASVYIANSPAAGTNETLTNAWALWIDAGNVRFDDNIHWYSGTSFSGILDHANSANRTYTFPNFDGTISTLAGTEALSNKTIGNTNTVTIKDTLFTIQDDGDATKLVAFQCSGITTGNTRTLTVPDSSGTLLTTASVAAQSDMETASSTSLLVTPGRTQYHPGVAKAWVKAGITGNIIVSHNVASLTDTAAGKITVTLTTSFSSADYVCNGTALLASASSVRNVKIASQAAGSFTAECVDTAPDFADPDNWLFSCFGDQ